jgi:hypothetical protein
MINLITKYLGSKFSGYISIAAVLGLIAVGAGGYFGAIRLADERCEGMVAQEALEALQKENASLRANTAKREAVRKDSQNATDLDLHRRATDLGIMRHD